LQSFWLQNFYIYDHHQHKRKRIHRQSPEALQEEVRKDRRLKELRSRTYFEKPSIARRTTVIRAAYREKMRAEENS
jgi:ribosomal protein S21